VAALVHPKDEYLRPPDFEDLATMAKPLADAILGCLVGGAIGDAAGSAAENALAPQRAPMLAEHLGPFTDDTQLTLATCDALAESPAPDPEIIAASFVRWYRGGRLSGLGSSTLKALRDLDAGAHWALSGRKGDQAAGNGAAMRIAPLAFCVDPRAAASRRLIRDISRITHHNDEAYIGALAVCMAIWGAAFAEWSLESIASMLPDTSVRDRLFGYAVLEPDVSMAEAAQKYGVSGYVAESVPFALFAASRVRTCGFTPMLEQITLAGGDTDSNGSIAGQIAGTMLGLDGLPHELVSAMPDTSLVLGIGRTFANAVVNHRK
jgi:ADP-ribosylglycohydrolase